LFGLFPLLLWIFDLILPEQEQKWVVSRRGRRGSSTAGKLMEFREMGKGFWTQKLVEKI
jgi:hypothetical protein